MIAPTKDATFAALRQNYLFQDLTDPEVALLAKQVWLEQIPAGSMIVCEGDDADALYVVVDGGVNVQKHSGQFLSYLGRGGFFGEMALFMAGLRRTADCVTSMDTTCAVIHKETLDGFCDANPTIGLKIYRAIIRTLAERLQATSADLATLMQTQVKGQDDIARMVAKARKQKKS